MEKAAETAGAKGGKRKGRRGAKRQSLHLTRPASSSRTSLPEGARFKGYEDFIIQDIVIKPWTVHYRRERWLLASGETVVAALPKGVTGEIRSSLHHAEMGSPNPLSRSTALCG